MYEVYKISNRINNKVYIGITSIGIKERWYAHVSCSRHSDQYHNQLYQDMNTYGPENFFIEVLESNISYLDRDDKEKFYIAKFNSREPNGYNLTDGGFSNDGVLWAESRGAKISRKLKNVPKSEEHRKKLSDSRKGRFTKSDNPFYGKHHSDETKRILGLANSKRCVEALDVKSLQPVKTFVNMNDGGRFVVSIGKSKAHYTTCASRISEVCKCNESELHCKAYGFYWRFVKV